MRFLVLHCVTPAALLLASGPAISAAPPKAKAGVTVPAIISVGKCQEGCDEYMSRQLQGTFATTTSACDADNRFYVYGDQIGIENGTVLMIDSARTRRSDDGNATLLAVTGSLQSSTDKDSADNPRQGSASLDYDGQTNRLTVTSSFSDPLVLLRCRVPLPGRSGE